MENTAQNVNIYSAIASIQREIGEIAKNKTNSQQGFNFRGIDDVYNAVHPLFSRFGVFSVPRVIESRYENYVSAKGTRATSVYLTVEYTFYAEDGSSVSCAVASEGNDFADKATNKAMAFAHKYAILQIFSIPTEDLEDGDRDTITRNGARTEPKTGIPLKEEPKKLTDQDIIDAIDKAKSGAELNHIMTEMVWPNFLDQKSRDDFQAMGWERKRQIDALKNQSAEAK